MEAINNGQFLEMTTEEGMDIYGGVADWMVAGAAIVGGWAIGHAIGYIMS